MPCPCHRCFFRSPVVFARRFDDKTATVWADTGFAKRQRFYKTAVWEDTACRVRLRVANTNTLPLHTTLNLFYIPFSSRLFMRLLCVLTAHIKQILYEKTTWLAVLLNHSEKVERFCPAKISSHDPQRQRYANRCLFAPNYTIRAMRSGDFHLQAKAPKSL